MDQNPYESPRSEGLPFTPTSTGNTDLEQRVAELERQVAQSWFLRQSFITRVVAVWAYLIIGYVMLLAIILPFAILLDWWLHRGFFSN